MESKYESIAARLRQDVENAVYSDKMPSERALAERFKTTTVTIRRAQDILIEEGLLRKVRPLGTFVIPKKRPTIRVVLLNPMFPKDVEDAIRRSFSNRFPNLKVELHSSANALERIDEFDLLRSSSVAAFPHDEVAVPFPNDVLRRFLNDQYIIKSFDAHRIGDTHYGLPVLVSPVLLLANLNYVSDEKTVANPWDVNADILLTMAEEARKQRLFLWSSLTAHYVARSLVFSAGSDARCLCDVDVDALRGLLKRYWPLFASDLVSPDRDAFKKDRAVLTEVCRQGMYMYDPKSTRLLAWPNDLKVNLGGEYLLINKRCPNPEQAAEVAAHCLSPEIQSLIGHNRVGLPVLKSAAFDSINSKSYRDDLFFNEIQRAYVTDVDARDFHHRLRLFVDEALAGELAFDTLMERLEYEINMTRKRGDTQRQFMMEGLSQAI